MHKTFLSAFAYGGKQQLAHYQSQGNPGDKILHAWANAIKWYPPQHKVYLNGHARVQQGKNRFVGTSISYDTKSQHIQSAGKQTLRPTITIYTEKQGEHTKNHQSS